MIMNYYIQGNKEKADQISSAFEKLGYDTSRHLFNAKSVLYFTLNGEIRATTCICTPAIIKSHPDYKELELPVEPKFKVGDWLFSNSNGVLPILVKDYSETQGYKVECIGLIYYVNQSIIENEYHPWTIADAKDGDVLVCYSEAKGSPIEQAGIFKQYVGRHGGCSNAFLAHIGIDWNGNIIINGYMGSTNILPATKEQRDLLFAKMKEAAYEWDADKKELRKIKPHYDISNFKPKQWVLVRNSDNQVWGLSMFSHRDMGCYICLNREDFTQCIPFNDDTKHLLGTTDMCPEEYINW